EVADLVYVHSIHAVELRQEFITVAAKDFLSRHFCTPERVQSIEPSAQRPDQRRGSIACAGLVCCIRSFGGSRSQMSSSVTCVPPLGIGGVLSSRRLPESMKNRLCSVPTKLGNAAPVM